MRHVFRLGLLSLIALFVILPFAAIKPAAAAGPPIGMNVGGVDDWGPDYMFADAIKQARFWRDTATGNNYNIGDANGWPTQDAFCGVWYASGTGAVGGNPMNGTYALSFNGQATVVASNGGVISNQVYTSATNTTTATLTLGNVELGLTFTNTKRTSGSATNTGITNVKLMRPTTEGGSTPIASNVTFTPAYETLLSKFSVLRFMDTTQTNGNQSVNWADRTPPTWWSQSSSAFDGSIASHCMAWEYVVQLINETGKDGWINIPRFASDDYITKMAQVFKYGSDGTNPYTSVQGSPVYPPLNAGRHVYVEYGNELWNFSPGEITAMGESEIFGYPVTTNGLAASVTNGVLSSVADFDNGVMGHPAQIPGTASSTNPNYFRDVIFNGATSVFTSQTPAATASDTAGGDELGMKFKSTTAGQITGLKFYKPVGETGTHTGHLWQYGAPSGSQVCWLWDGGGAAAQAMTFPTTGSYTVSFYGSSVTGENQATVQVSVDGVNVGSVIPLSYGFTQYTSAAFTISTTGSHTIKFTNTYPTDWGRAMIDLVTVSGPGTVTVANNSFESPNIGGGPAPKLTGNTGYQYWVGDSWTMSGSGAGLTINGVSGAWGDFGCFGKLLGTVAFSGESASGWQTATLSPAVSIAANTTYMVSVNSNTTYNYTNSMQSGPLTWDGNMGGAYNRKWVERAVQGSNIFRSVFGDAAMPGTSANPIVRPVLMMLASGGWIDNYTYQDLLFLQDYFNNQAALTAKPDGAITTAHPPTYYFYGGGGAPYYDPSGTYDINSVWATGDWDTTHFTNTWLVGTANYYIPQWGHFISYEGGPELPGNDTLSVSIWNDARMESLETSHQTAYNQYGGDLWVYYNTTNVYRWGFTNDIYNLAAPKIVGIDQMNASTQAVSTYGTGIPATIAANTTVPAFGAPNLNNMTASVNHADYAGYVVNTASASVFNIGLSAGSAGTTNQADIYADGALVGTITIPNTGSNTTYATTTTVATPSLGIGTHGIMVKAKSGSFGLSALLVTGGTVTIPNPPTGLTAAGTYQQVSLAWNSTTGATSYSVYRGTTAGGESGTAIATGLITTSYTNTGLTNGTTYYYTVKAVNTAGTSGASNEASAQAVDNVAHLVNAAVAPTIDGANTDACWTAATSYGITLLDGGVITNGSDCSGSFKGAWDSTNLYLLADVTDDVKVNDSTNAYDDDCIEVFIDGDNSKGTSYDGDDVQYLFGWNDAAATAGSNAGSKMTGVIMGQANPTSTTYRIEMQIPWSSIGTTATSGKLTGLDMHIDDDDDGAARDGALDWKDPNNVAWGNPSVFGIARLDPASGGAPPAPTGLTATPGNAQVVLNWTASAGATTYNVLRSTVNGSGYASVATGIVPVTYTNTGLTNGTTYYFVVTATNASGTSGNSNQASAAPVAPPAAPTGLTATAGNTQAVLSWTASGGATSYNALRSTVSGSGYASVATGIAVTNYTNTGLTNGTTYYFVVTATNAGGTSGNSNQASATPSAVPAAPTGLTTSTGNAQSLIFWTASTGATSYNVLRSTVSGSGYASIATGLAVTYFDNTGLTNGTTYYYVAQAVNASGTSPDSAQASAAPAVAPQAQVAFATTAPVIDGTADAIWSSATAYPINNVMNFAPGTITSNADLSGSFQTLWDATNLYVLVTVTDDVLLKYVTNPWDADTIEVMIDADHNGGTAYDANDFQYFFPWNSATIVETKHSPASLTGVTFAQTNIAGGYRIEAKIPWSTLTVTPAANNLVGVDVHIDDADTTAGTRDGKRMWNDTTDQAWTNPSLFGTGKLVGGAPAPPTGLTATAGNAQVTLNWTASSGATAYDVKRSTVSGSGYVTVSSPTTTSYTNTGLTNGTTYYFVVDAKNASGTSANSSQVSATPVSSGIQLVTDPFSAATGKLDGAGGGTGWAAGWFTQNNDATIPGYNVANTTPLTYTGLTTSGNYGVGGSAFQSTGRAFDVTAGGPFGTNGYLSGGLIGASGKTLWMGILIRKDVNNQNQNWITLHNGVNEWAGAPGLSVGYYGAASETGGTKFWSINLGGTVTKSNVAITIGATALLVAKIDYAATTTVTLYVNPASLGGSAPGTSNAVASTATSLASKYLAYYAGDSAGQSSIDEIKFGTTYAAVTR